MERLTDLSARLAALRTDLPLFVEPLLALAVAIALALIALNIVYRIVFRHFTDGDSPLAQFLRRARRPLRLGAVLLAIGAVSPGLALSVWGREALQHAVLAGVVVLIGWSVLIAVDILTARSVRKHRLDVADNLTARKYLTQIRILKRATKIVTVILTIGAVLMTFEGVREYGVSLFASAGAAGLVLGFAARPVLANLIAGVQIALTQPIRIDDVVIVEGEWGWIEEIYATYVVVRIWDWRRLIVPLSYFIEQPFQNWTRESASIMGSVFWYVDYTMPVAEMREVVERIISESPHWDGQVKVLQVVDVDKDVMHLRALMSSRNSPTNWDLRCEVREKVMAWMQEAHPEALPRLRGEMEMRDGWSMTGNPGGQSKGPEAPQRVPQEMKRQE
ncbi:putative mechanosensitive channel protein [Jannaschia seosinensis]|uniref:Putative mechanosensitive channel protein n=1 Tax=Jannaschia seosinensis TaxID=313367 RepID=A0A0M7BB93_9RHOB|nr:mechanosensitive ion channel family protein [Jannaschia seosinensis]CUH39082.1 putative mechanosensitive channel protein [Jannaschia seosinensis]